MTDKVEKVIKSVTCKHCHKSFDIPLYQKDYDDWKMAKGFIQDLMGYLSAGERELLISSTCDTCFG
jgi:hypothetical protein